MGYFDADAEDMLEVYLLETRQLTGQLSAVLLEAEKKNAFAEEDIHSIFRIMAHHKEFFRDDGASGIVFHGPQA